MVPNVIERVWVQGTTTKVESLRGTAFTEEDGAHTFRIAGVDASGETVPLSGTVLAKILRADNITIDVSGTITDGVASVTMVGDCYHVPGRFSIVVYLSDGVTTIAIYAAVGDIYRATSDTELDSGTTVPSLVQLEAAYQNALSATAAANTAATGAERVNVSMSKSGDTITFSATDRTGATTTATMSDQSEEVADLESDVTDLENNVANLNSALIPIQKSTLEIQPLLTVTDKYLRKSDGAFVNNANYVISKFIQVNEGDVLYYKSDAPAVGAIVGLYADPDWEHSYVKSVVDGTGALVSGSVTIDQDGYIAFCCNVQSVDKVYLYFDKSLVKQIKDNTDTIATNTNSITKINTNVAKAVEGVGNNTKSIALSGNSVIIHNGYIIRSSDGMFIVNSGYGVSDFIPVKAGDKIYYKSDIPSGYAIGALYSSPTYETGFIEVAIAGSSGGFSEGVTTISQDGYLALGCNVLSVGNAYFYFEGFLAEIVKNLQESVSNNTLEINNKVNKPSSNGISGQFLKTNGDGTTDWDDPIDQSAVTDAVDDWLNAHPEATTTVEDGSITSAKIASGSFIAGGTGNAIRNVAVRDSDSKDSHAEGYKNIAQEWYDHVEGCGCIVDGKISHVEGNACICTANDAHAEGNRTVAGRRYYHKSDGSYLTKGAEDAGDSLGVLNYVIVPDAYGDVTSFFPNALIDNVETRYGTGAQIDVKGNVYAGTPYNFVPAIWNGDTVVTPNDLRWAMHSICILRGTAENHIVFVNIAKAVYTSGSGTKIYYYGNSPYANYLGIYSSYAPRLLKAGNGTHAEGFFTSAWGTGSHSEGQSTDAWGDASHTEGVGSVAMGYASHAQGLYTRADGIGSDASGKESKASRSFQKALSSGKIASVGDNQACEIILTKRCPNAGWHNVPLITNVENGKSYLLETMVVGKQSAGLAGNIGDTFGYKFTALINVKSDGTYEAIGTPERLLIGRSSGMDGDGLSSGVRLSWYNGIYPDDRSLCLRMDGITNAIFYVTCHTKWVELAA